MLCHHRMAATVPLPPLLLWHLPRESGGKTYMQYQPLAQVLVTATAGRLQLILIWTNKNAH